MIWLKFILNAIELFVYAYLSISASYFLIMCIAGFFRFRHRKPINKKIRKIAVLIPAYKEDQVIVSTAKNACKQAYPDKKFEVFVISDSLKQETLGALHRLKVNVIEVIFEKRTKAKALNAAAIEVGSDFEVVLIIDADNIMEKDFLTKINESFNRGFRAVQGHRVAKNLNNSMAILDAMSEEVNNHLFRKGHQVIGLSAALIGSGMAFDSRLFGKIISKIDSVAEDKEIEFSLLKSGYKIDYLHHAIVYDEKTQRSDDFVKQRSRWLGIQIMSLRKYFCSGFYQLIKEKNIDYFDRVMQMLLPPRILAIGFLSVTITFYGFGLLFVPAYCNLCIIPFFLWLILWAVSLLVIALSIPRRLYNKKSLVAFLSLPKGLILMILALLKSGNATNKFVHTQHYTSETNEENEAE